MARGRRRPAQLRSSSAPLSTPARQPLASTACSAQGCFSLQRRQSHDVASWMHEEVFLHRTETELDSAATEKTHLDSGRTTEGGGNSQGPKLLHQGATAVDGPFLLAQTSPRRPPRFGECPQGFR